MDQPVYDYKNRADDRKDVIGGLLIILAGWHIASILRVLSNIALLSRYHYEIFNEMITDISYEFVDAARVGYYILIPLTIFLAYCFFTKKKIYPLVEGINFLTQTVFLGALVYVQSDLGLITNAYGRNLTMSALVSLVFLVYLKFGKRPKTTFIRNFDFFNKKQQPKSDSLY